MVKKLFIESVLMNVSTITVNVFGSGGTGSHLIDRLGAVSHAINVQSGRRLQVTAYDFDIVSDRNVARSKFLQGDVGLSKVQIAISKANLGYGLNWSCLEPDCSRLRPSHFNFLCTDDAKSREEYIKAIKLSYRSLSNDTKPRYIIDIGNDKDFGQIVMIDLDGKLADIDRKTLTSETIGTPSCGNDNPFALQDLFINDAMSLFASEMFYRFITDFNLDYSQIFVNLGMMKIISKLVWK